MAQPATHETLMNLGVLFASGALSAFVFHKIKLPSVLGFILAGALLGPSVLNWVKESDLGLLSELGIIFLLFLVGLELSISKIKRLKFQAPLSGILQLTFSGAILTTLLSWGMGLPLQLAFLFGSILALSSTAIVLRQLEEHRELESLHGRVILAILIVQDMAIVPLMTLVSALSKPLGTSASVMEVILPTALDIGKALLIAIAATLVSLKLLPRILDYLAKANQKEILLLSAITIALGAAWTTNALGISYEAGALIAGISLSGSLFAHQVFADSRAYRDVFVMIFFISMGLWVDVDYIASHWLLVIVTTLSLSTVKALSAYAAIRLSGFHRRSAIWGGLALFQAGEFSFVALTQLMASADAVPQWSPYIEVWAPLIRNTIVITMFITPLMLKATPWITNTISGALREKPKAAAASKGSEENEPPAVLIAGFGPVAKQLTRALKHMDLGYCVIEMNANTVKTLQKMGEPCLYGDAAHTDILMAAGIEQAQFFVITFPDIEAAAAAIRQAKVINPEIIILVRARYEMDISRLSCLGAEYVVCEEFETSIDFADTLMRIKEVPEEEIRQLINALSDKEGLGLKRENAPA
ncbi:MAG: cation:proton antiporter [Vampirovibrionales bacterium]|nr:cation:proton antiporter [Vampirovibrionales bacterium]